MVSADEVQGYQLVAYRQTSEEANDDLDKILQENFHAQYGQSRSHIGAMLVTIYIPYTARHHPRPLLLNRYYPHPFCPQSLFLFECGGAKALSTSALESSHHLPRHLPPSNPGVKSLRTRLKNVDTLTDLAAVPEYS